VGKIEDIAIVTMARTDPFPAKKAPSFKVAQDYLKVAENAVKNAREWADVEPDTELAAIFDVMEEYLPGARQILKEREKAPDG
jgi:hypothetical protein